MAGQTLALADAVLKEDYHGPLRLQINNMVVLAAQIAKNREDLVGRRAIVPLQVSRNTGVGARLEGEQMPAAGNQGTVDQLVSLRSNYGRIRLTRQVISRMASDRGAFVRAVSFEMESLRNDVGRDYNRQLWGTSDGVLAQCGVTTTSLVVVLAATTPEQVLVNFAEGMLVDIGTVATPTSITSARVVGTVDFTNKTITLVGGATISTTAANFVFRQGSGGSGANQRELTGMQTQVAATGALFGVDPATYFSWASIVEGNAGVARPVSDNVITKAMMRSRNRSGQTDWALYAEDQAYRSAVNNLSAKHRLVNTLDLKGGHSAVAYVLGGKEYPLIAERDAPVGSMYGLAHPKLVEYLDEDWQWEDMDGAALHMSMDGTHTFEAYLFKFSEVATSQRNAHFIVQDLELS
jgi:hypothetical protein